jgi:bifunctional NMN adenylyltransferase/nudix hydrolase
MEKYTGTVFIGRIQPPHNSHIELLRHALKISNKLLIIIGSSEAARNVKNPFTFEERKEMILNAFPKDRKRIIVEPQRDYYYNETQWNLEVTEKVRKHFNLTDSLGLVGMYKDHSSYYLRNFPFLEFIPFHHKFSPKDATEVRESLFENPLIKSESWEDKKIPKTPWYTLVPESTKKFIEEEFIGTELFTKLQDEYNYVKNYKKQWAKSPYPPTFITTDFILKCGSNVLLVKRKIGAGKGLIAMPGGFVRQHEAIQQASIRELREETCLEIDPEELETLIRQVKVFDHPQRSLRGRTVTHAFFAELPIGKGLPAVKGSDDAAEAFWMPVYDIYQRPTEFYEDHFHIIHYFLSKEK